MKAGRPLIELAKLCCAARRPFLLVGRHGVGKSELLAKAAAELGIGCICRDLSLMEPPDLVGLPKMDGAVTRFLPPAFLPTEGRGLLVFEELNRCAAYMRGPCLQLLTARTLNDYTLPADWVPAAAINPSDAGYEVEELDPALLSRFVRIDVEPDRGEWLAWARDGGIHPDVIRYVESDPTVFEDPESTPRAWAGVSDLLHAATEEGTPRDILFEAVAGLVGRARAAAFSRGRRGDEPLRAEQVLAYPVHRDRLLAWRKKKAGRPDLVKASLLAILTHLQAKRNYDRVRGDRDAWENLGLFLGDLPGDLREQAMADFRERGYESPRASTPRARRRA
jgi:MoxR-like ATPase